MSSTNIEEHTLLDINLDDFSESLPFPELSASSPLLFSPINSSSTPSSTPAATLQTELDSSRHANFSHRDSVYCVALHPTSPLCATGGGDDVAFLWNYASGERAQLSTHQDSVADISFSPDGKYLAVAGLDGIVTLWTTNLQSPTAGPSSSSSSTTSSSSSTPFISDRCPRFNPSMCTLLHALEGPEDGVEWLRWHPSGAVLVGGSQDASCWMWSVAKGRCMQVFSGHGGYVTCGAFSHNGKKLVTGSVDATLRVWNPQTASSVRIGGGKFHRGAITTLEMMAGAPLVLSGGEDGLLGISNVMTAKAVSALQGSGASIESLASSAAANIAAAGTMKGQLLLWDCARGVLRSQFDAHQEAITRLVAHPKEPLLFSASIDGTVKAWDIRANNQCLRTFHGPVEGVLDMAVNADGTFIAVASEDGSTSIFSYP